MLHLLLELLDVTGATLGRCVAAVHKAVHKNILQFVHSRHLEKCEEMSKLGMHAAVAAETKQMQTVPCSFVHGVQEYGIVEELTRADHKIEARHIHIDDSAGAHVHMSYFTVAHL